MNLLLTKENRLAVLVILVKKPDKKDVVLFKFTLIESFIGPKASSKNRMRNNCLMCFNKLANHK